MAPKAQPTLVERMHFSPRILIVILPPFPGLVSITLITRGGALRFALRLPLANFFQPLRGGSFRKS